MSTVIVTPLFPPDPSDSARYTKLLTEKLKPDAVLLFGSLPEAVPGVTLLSVSKRASRPIRALLAFWHLLKLHPATIVVQNGPSSELPVLCYSWVRRVSVTYVISDFKDAQNQTGVRAKLAKRLQQKASRTITVPPDASAYLPPEWLPYNEPTAHERQCHDDWWSEHLKQFNLT